LPKKPKSLGVAEAAHERGELALRERRADVVEPGVGHGVLPVVEARLVVDAHLRQRGLGDGARGGRRSELRLQQLSDAPHVVPDLALRRAALEVGLEARDLRGQGVVHRLPPRGVPRRRRDREESREQEHAERAGPSSCLVHAASFARNREQRLGL